MEGVIATFHLRRSKITARCDQEGQHRSDCQLRSLHEGVPQETPNYSSGRETTEVCQPSALQTALRVRQGTQLQ